MEDLKEEIQKLKSKIEIIESYPSLRNWLATNTKQDLPTPAKIETNQKFIIPDKYSFTINEVAEILDKDPKTIWHNTGRTPDEPLYLKAFKISAGNIRIKNKDLSDFILRVYNQDIEVPVYMFPVNVPLTTKQITYLLNCYVDTATAIKGKKEMTFRELEEFICKNYLMEPIIKPRK